jgi:hypothetical protein
MEDLPNEMYLNILRFLPHKDARKLSRTSRRMHSVVADNPDIKLAATYDKLNYFELKEELKVHPRAVTKYMDHVFQLAQDKLGNEHIFQRYFNNFHDAVELMYYLNNYKSRDTADIKIREATLDDLEYRVISKGSVHVKEVTDPTENAVYVIWETAGVETRHDGPSTHTYYDGILWSEEFHIGGAYNGDLSEVYYYPDGTIKRKWMLGLDDENQRATLIKEEYDGKFNSMRSFHLAIKGVLIGEHNMSPQNADTRAREILDAFRASFSAQIGTS